MSAEGQVENQKLNQTAAQLDSLEKHVFTLPGFTFNSTSLICARFLIVRRFSYLVFDICLDSESKGFSFIIINGFTKLNIYPSSSAIVVKSMYNCQPDERMVGIQLSV